MDYYKDFPLTTREWNNSIYIFNKNTLGLIPQSSISTIKLIKAYLNLYNSNIERKIRRTRLLRRLRRLSSHKIYLNNGEFKHTNDKVTITLYTYNKQKYNYLSALKKRYLNIFFNKKRIEQLNKRFFLIKYKSLEYLQKINKDKYIIIKNLNKFNKIKNKNFIDNYKIFYYNDYLINFYKKWVKKSLKKIKFYLYLKQLIYINETKYNYTYLQMLKNFIQKIYNKKIEFNLINLKYNYLNSDILSESINLKITRNRRKILKYLNRLMRKIKIYKMHRITFYGPKISKLNVIKTINDPIENLLDNKAKPNTQNIEKIVLEEIKYKRLSGVRLESTGRLTRRYTASRSVSKLRYKGNLVNIDSSYKGLSTVLLKGNLKSNLQYTKLKSKTRIGSFGIKVWVSGN